MRCSFAKRSRAETDFVLRGKATASGTCAANHLSPACCLRTVSSKVNSAAGKTRLSLDKSFESDDFILQCAFDLNLLQGAEAFLTCHGLRSAKTMIPAPVWSRLRTCTSTSWPI